MAPILTEEEAALDPYTLLQLTAEATEKDVRRAYKKLSLKYHPDKNSTPEAAIMFRQISLSLEILVDQAKRAYLDGKLEGDRRKRERYAEMDKKRKAMVDVSYPPCRTCRWSWAHKQALNQREEEAKRAKVEAVEKRRQAAIEEEIKEQGKRMLEEAQRRAAAAAQTAAGQPAPAQSRSAMNGNRQSNGHAHSTSSTSKQPPITPIDLTLTLQLPASASSDSTALQSELSSRYGPISHVHLRAAPAEEKPGKKKKGPKGIVEFAAGNWGGCWACWKDHSRDATGDEARHEGVAGMKAKWALGRTPDWVEWADKTGQQPNTSKQNGSSHVPDSRPSMPSFESAPDFGGTSMAELLSRHQQEKADRARREQDESMTLLRMRQMERQKLEEQIRREEELEV